MINQKIAEQFDEIADMLEILGESVFRIRAYRRGSDIVMGLPQDLLEMHEKEDDEIEKISGIGKDLHAKIIEIIENGKCEMHTALVKKLSPGILDILKVRSVGPKKAKLFLEELGVDNIEKLTSAAESGALADLPGMGEKSQDSIITALKEATHLQKRIPLEKALPEAEQFVEYMKKCKSVEKVEYAGSLRRRLETIGDIDILVAGKDAEKMSAHFLAYPKVLNVLAAGKTKSSVVIEGNIQVDFRVVAPESFGAALYYFTGSKYHNIQVRTYALKKGLKINEYGIYKGEEMLAGKTEEDLFAALGMDYIPPEIREDHGEMDAALQGKLPKLIEINDIRGDFFAKSDSDIYEMAVKAEALGREYIAVTAESVEIDKALKKVTKEGLKIKILKRVEGVILKNGDVNLDDDVLEKFDLVSVSIAESFDLTRKEQTERILKAFKNPHVNVFANPGSLEIDYQKTIKAAKDVNIAFDVGTHAKLCKDLGVKVVINDPLKFGIFMARRGWLEKDDVLNTLSYAKLIKLLK